jgi:hypothetical protein
MIYRFVKAFTKAAEQAQTRIFVSLTIACGIYCKIAFAGCRRLPLWVFEKVVRPPLQAVDGARLTPAGMF